MKTPDYRYKIIAAASPNGLEVAVNIAAGKGWGLVPGQSVSTAAVVYPLDDGQRESEWSYTVMMRTLA